MRIASLVGCLLLVGCVEDEVLVAAPMPVQSATASARAPLRDEYAGCFPRTAQGLVRTDDALTHHALETARAELTSADAAFHEEDAVRHCPTDAYARVHARLVLLRTQVARAAGTPDVDVLLSLGDDSFRASECEPDIAARCGELAGFLHARFPLFTSAYEARVTPLFRLPITPQPNGRLTVETMTYIQRRLDALDSDFVAFSVQPSSTTTVDSHLELRVDGTDVHEGSEHKPAAHFIARIPATDIVHARGASTFVVVFDRKAMVHDQATWRAVDARIAYGER